ncbi:hypothetical protein Vau01_046490 [Virgisporangium aurantiacum]|uniref:Uncharacterized protein n=1 Tax=Virgisporangium aurantiacum TaxID=175570 RepID=A0A8J4E0W0_9ACTN|nr:hypothetical protein Vau01_046490 [Virgisporangium aurantiacum]
MDSGFWYVQAGPEQVAACAGAAVAVRPAATSTASSIEEHARFIHPGIGYLLVSFVSGTRWQRRSGPAAATAALHLDADGATGLDPYTGRRAQGARDQRRAGPAGR